jgi:hypothetical protein
MTDHCATCYGLIPMVGSFAYPWQLLNLARRVRDTHNV